ncbi:Hsp20/alpha crystallin family protein [Caldimonas sp. KR1-144]|uniref:Hsp20/alpha crystallin family protein n=1 Tax=Caldimonas sp. KR1-144 TaxID=3400911 RepID=UPI003C120E5E
MNTSTQTSNQLTEREARAAAVSQQRSDPALTPPVDVIEDSTGITLYADMPGVPKDRLSVHVDGDQLSVAGEIVLPVPQDMTSSHAEVQRFRYERRFTLSKELDADRISAQLSHGVLTLRIPKAEHAQPRRIEVRVS